MVYHDPQIDDDWESFCNQADVDERRELAEIRNRLNLTQEEAAKITGGGHNGFSRYERGEAQPLMAIVNLFRLLDRYPSLLPEVTFPNGVHSHSLEYTLSEPITEGWGSVPTRRAGVHSFRVVVPIDAGSAANEWNISTDVIGIAAGAP
jgi:DNA-binding XRE family transcriptional regulator